MLPDASVHRSPRTKRLVLLGLVLVSGLAFAGCTSEDPAITEFPDTTVSFTAATAGEEDRHEETYRFEVSEEGASLRIGVAYRLEPEARLVAVVRRSADGIEVGGLENLGPVAERDPSWFRLRNATAGAWQVEVALEGEGAFTFGVFLEDQDPPTP